MNNIKKSLLEEIDNKIKKRKIKKENSLDMMDYRTIVYDFLKNVEQSRSLINEQNQIEFDLLNRSLIKIATNSMLERLRIIDSGCSVALKLDDQNIVGVTINWSSNYANKHKIDKSIYVDVTDMLLL